MTELKLNTLAEQRLAANEINVVRGGDDPEVNDITFEYCSCPCNGTLLKASLSTTNYYIRLNGYQLCCEPVGAGNEFGTPHL